MAKIILEIDKAKLNTVVTILRNLKIGLIKDMKIEEKSKVLEDDFMETKPSNSKYLSKSEFKERLKKKS